MLCTLIREPFTDEDWLYEVKFDGYRILAYKQKDSISLRSRKLDLTKNYPVLIDNLESIEHDFVVDGEVVALDETGKPDFDALQRYRRQVRLLYYVFDLLWLDGNDLTGLPLTERKIALQQILPESTVIQFSRNFEDGIALYETVKNQGLEGIVAKRKDSAYIPGKRSTSWLKLPTKRVQDFVVGAYTESESGKVFRSMIFANYVNGKFTYVGHVGHGFTDKEQKEILEKLKKYETDKCPFTEVPKTETKAHWLKPELVIKVEYSTWTDSGSIRKPAIFKGFRTDKLPKDVVPEKALSSQKEQKAIEAPQEQELASDTSASKKKDSAKKDFKSAIKKQVYLNEDSNWKELDKIEKKDPKELPVGDYKVEVYDLGKVLWKEPEVKKADLLSYYASISDYILPYLKDRPLSVYIKDISPTAPGLYIKDFEGRAPEYADVFTTERKHKKAGKRDVIEYFVVNNLASLLYLVNLGAIDFNPWSSRTVSPDYPDYITIDLDPSDGDFKKAIETALAAKEIFDKYKLKGFRKPPVRLEYIF